ncbi:MAG TPA: hypothetical protein VHE30_21085 [Polyangiaceae bacterium]|nr:hypothetical protein [Polyangiaceae bacterium]
MTARLARLVPFALALLSLTPEVAGAEPKGRDITYRVTGDGLVIEVEGIELEPSAVPVKTGRGWIVKLDVKATVRDRHSHRLLSPEQGPLMVAAVVQKAGKEDKVGDERKGDTEMTLSPDSPETLTRKVDVPVAPGQTLTLNVGLWGLAKDDEKRRPVKKLFIVKMVAGATAKPTPVITPPE